MAETSSYRSRDCPKRINLGFLVHSLPGLPKDVHVDVVCSKNLAEPVARRSMNDGVDVCSIGLFDTDLGEGLSRRPGFHLVVHCR